jgi:hypothetical protein
LSARKNWNRAGWKKRQPSLRILVSAAGFHLLAKGFSTTKGTRYHEENPAGYTS